MKIARIRIGAFGRLEDFDTGPEALPGMVVLLGPNEAGKSTLFHFLTTALYGFRPASREGNPYLPWGADEAGGRVDVQLDDGACLEVERRLRSQPTGRILVDGRTDDLRNQPLPWTAHVPYAVFRQVFAVTLHDLAGLDEETWAGIQDRILGAMGATDLAPARQVVSQLEAEAGSLWRPNRRGNQRIRDIQDAIRDLRGRRGEALERDRRLRDLVADRDRTRARLEEVRQERHRQRAAVERVQSLMPVRAQLRRIVGLREDAGPMDVLRTLPADPRRNLEELTGQISALERRGDELTADMAEPKRAVEAVGGREQSFLARSDEISAFLARAAGSAADRARLNELEQGVSEVERRLDGAAEGFLAVPWRELPAGSPDRVPLSELRERVRRYRAAREERRIAEMGAPRAGDTTTAPSASLAGGLTLLVTGVALLALGLDGAQPIPIALGGAATAVGAALTFLWLRGRRARGTAAPSTSVEEMRQAEDEALRGVRGILEGFPLLEEATEDPGELLVAGVERIKELMEDRRSRTAAIQDIRTRTSTADAEATALAAALELDTGLSTEAVAHVLDRELHRAERLKEAADAGAREVRRLERERARTQAELADVEGRAKALEERLGSLGDGDPARGADIASARLQAALRADELQDELERAHPDLEELQARIAAAEASGESWTVDEDDLARRKAAIEGLDEELERLASTAEALDRDALHLQEEETVDGVDGEIGTLRDEEARLTRERDRQWVLAHLVREADRRFRDEHQPDLVRRAGSYLAHLTGGRYDRMLVDDAANEGVFQIVGPALPAPIPLAHPISTGTLEQAYLALRLAIVDHLDRGGERLPLFVDEVFVNWDDRRRARGVDLLTAVAKTRQLFFFTCHPEMASVLEAKGAKVIPLADGEP